MDRLIFITCHEAKGLKNTDGFFSKSDPYVNICKFNGRVAGGNRNEGRNSRTATVKNNLSPVVSRVTCSCRTRSMRVAFRPVQVAY